MSVETKTVKPRRLVEAMPEYHPPLGERDALRLDFNENTLAPSPKVLERLRQITAEGLTKYPDREPAERAVAAHFGLASDQVLLTNGVDEALHLICCALLEDGDEAMIAPPNFFMYNVNITMMTRGLVKVQSDASLAFPFERFMAAITDRTKLMIVASPNNPTGACVSREQLLAIAKAAPQAVLLVDEAYYHFHGETVIGDLAEAPNVVVARTFSKAYGLANLRIGMLAGSSEMMRHLRKVSSPYNVNGVALDCLQSAIEDDSYLAWYIDQIRTGRERMMAGLDRLGVSYFPSEANFVLMKIGPKHKEFVARMRAHGVLVRDRSTDPGCDGYVRITIGVEQHVTMGLEAVEASLKEIGWRR